MVPRFLPNAITLARLACVPVIVWLSYGASTGRTLVAASLFALAVASDWLDGYLARRLGLRSALGTLIDPLVDKVMILSLLFVFADRGLVPMWLVLLNMAREFAVTAVRHTVSSRGSVVRANWMGKAKFCLQAGFLGLSYAYLIQASRGATVPGGTDLLFWALLAITVVSYAFLARFVLWHRALLSVESGGPPDRSGP